MSLETEKLTLPSGAEIEVEVTPGRGARDAAPGSKSLVQALQPLREVVEVVLGELRDLHEGVDSVTVEMGASLQAGAKLLLVQGDASSTLKVTVQWKHREK